MGYTEDQLRGIYDRYGGCCAYCTKRLSIQNYGRHGERGSWHVDHRRSRANGGGNHGNNLAAACINCNLDKGALNARTYQRRYQVETDSGWGWVAGGLLLALLLGAAGANGRGGGRGKPPANWP